MRSLVKPWSYRTLMFRFANISKIDADKCLARVTFEEDNLESDWLPVLQRGSKVNKYFSIPDIGEHVVCLMDCNAENGVILGAIYDESVLPGDVKGADVTGADFDGDTFEYDRAAKKFTLKIGGIDLDLSDDLAFKTGNSTFAMETSKVNIKNGTTEFNIAAAGPSLKKGSASLKTLMSDLLDGIMASTYTNGSGATGPPNNLATFTSLKVQILAFFDA